MNILVVGGTRYFGIHMVKRLLADGHQVTIATRGRNKDPFGNQVERIHMDSYDEIKRQAEAALYQEYGHIPSVAVRFPYVIGEDDYTNRLYFYVEHIVKEIPMKLIGEEEKITFIDSRNAGELLAWFAEENLTGIFNACNDGCMSVSEIIQYVEEKTGKKAILTEEGEAGPYNGTPSFTLNVDKLKKAGYQLPPLSSYSNQLLDAYIERALS